MREIQEKIKRLVNELKSNPSEPSAELKHFLEFKKKFEEQKLSKSESTAAKIKQYAAVEATHALRGPASDADAAARLAICMSCEHRAETYRGVTDEDKVGWCTKCGCGNNPRAKLKVKVTLAGAACPEKKWGQVEGTGGSVASVAGAVAGVAASLAHAILPQKKSE